MDASVIELLTNLAIFAVVFFALIFAFKIAVLCLVAYIAYKKREFLIALTVSLFKYFFPKKSIEDSEETPVSRTTP